MEGMQGFVRRHRATLDPARTTVLCLECVGSPTLTLVEAEGMLRMRHYSQAARERLAGAAGDGRRGDRDGGCARSPPPTRSSRCATATPRSRSPSIDHTKFPANYHWPSDTPENLDWTTMERAFAVAERFIRA